MIEKKKVKSEYTRRNKDEGVDVELGDGTFIQDASSCHLLHPINLSIFLYLSLLLCLINISYVLVLYILYAKDQVYGGTDFQKRMQRERVRKETINQAKALVMDQKLGTWISFLLSIHLSIYLSIFYLSILQHIQPFNYLSTDDYQRKEAEKMAPFLGIQFIVSLI